MTEQHADAESADVTPLHPELEEPTEAAIAVRADIVGPPGPAEWRAMREQAMAICTTEFVPKEMRGSPEKVLAAILTGRELGLGPMAAMQGIRIQDGKPAYDAELMRALVRRKGHDIEAVIKTHKECVVWGRRRDTGREAWVRWDLEDARIANLIDSIKDDGLPQARSKNGYPLPWEQYPRRMLFARATGELVADLFADVLVGSSYTPEEIGAVSDWNEPEDPEAQQRRLESSRLVGMIDQAIEEGRITGPEAGEAAKQHGLRTRSEVVGASPEVLQSVIETLGIDKLDGIEPNEASGASAEEPTQPPQEGAQAAQEPPDAPDGRLADQIRQAARTERWEPDEADLQASGSPVEERGVLLQAAADLVDELDLDQPQVRAVVGYAGRAGVARKMAQARLGDLRTAVDMLEAERQRRLEASEGGNG